MRWTKSPPRPLPTAWHQNTYSQARHRFCGRCFFFMNMCAALTQPWDMFGIYQTSSRPQQSWLPKTHRTNMRTARLEVQKSRLPLRQACGDAEPAGFRESLASTCSETEIVHPLPASMQQHISGALQDRVICLSKWSQLRIVSKTRREEHPLIVSSRTLLPKSTQEATPNP